MRKAFSVVTSLLLGIAATQTSHAIVESTREFSVQVSATVQAVPAQITVSWPQDSCAMPHHYTVFRKAPGATAWGAGTTLPGTATSYIDTHVTAGRAYEYQI